MPQTIAPKTEFEKAIELHTKGLKHVSAGIASCCSCCQHDFHLDEESLQTALENGSVNDEGGFSWAACECCGSLLGGNRYSAHGFDKDGGVVHLAICEDCLCFLSNGDIPEKWGKYWWNEKKG